MKFNTQFNRKETVAERQNGVIITVPEHTVTMRSLLNRHATGQLLPIGKKGVYNENYPYPDIQSMDLIDIQEIKIELQQQQDEAKTQLGKIKAEEKRRKAELQSKAQSADPQP